MSKRNTNKKSESEVATVEHPLEILNSIIGVCIKIFLFVFIVVAPLISVLIFTERILGYPKSGWLELYRFGMWMFFVPIMAVYLGMIFFSFFPEKFKDRLVMLFGPILAITWGCEVYLAREETGISIGHILLAEFAPFIVILGLIMGIGVLFLAITTMLTERDGIRTNLLRICTLAMILGPWSIILISIIQATYLSWNIVVAEHFVFEPITALRPLIFIGYLLFIGYPYFKQMGVLYKKGEL